MQVVLVVQLANSSDMLLLEAGKLLYIPPVLSIFSLAYISFNLLHYIVSSKKQKDVVRHQAPTRSLYETVKELDGSAILSFRCLRLVCSLALLSLEIYRWTSEQPVDGYLYQIFLWVSKGFIYVFYLLTEPQFLI